MAGKTVLILGGGVGGLATANELRHRLGEEHRGVPGDRHTMETQFSGVYAIEAVAQTLAAQITGRGHEDTFGGQGECFIEVGGGKAGFGRGNFYTEPKPSIKLNNPGRHWHAGKVLFEKDWIRLSF